MQFKRIFAAVLASATVMSIGVTVPLADETLPEDGLIMNITFDEDGTGTGSFTATAGGEVKEHGSVSYVDNYDASSKALKISTEAAGNYLELPTGLLYGKEAATFSFWIKPSSRWAFMTTPVSGEQEYLYEQYLGMLATSSGFTAERYNNGGTRLSSVTAAASGDWQYITTVFTENGTKIYVNGSLEASDTAEVDIQSLFTEDASTWIGHGNWSTGEGFCGMMDDFRLYGRALTEEEISQLAAKAVERETQKMLEEKNCLEIDTQFYLKDAISYEENGMGIDLSVPSTNEKKVVIIGAAYSDGKLSNVKVQDADLKIGSNSFKIDNVKKDESDTVKAFVWNSVSGIKPIPDPNGSKVFQIAEGQTVTVKTTVTNYTPAQSNIAFDVIPYDSEGNALEHTASAPVSLDVMESEEFSDIITCDGSAAYYRVNVRNNEIEDYDAGYLPVADVSFPDAAPADSASATEGVHDPTIFKDPVSHKYYVYSTHNLVFESEDLINWTKYDYTADTSTDVSPSDAQPSNNNNTGIAITVPQSAYSFIKANYNSATPNGTYWAPDILYKEGDEYPYWFYLSTSCGLGGRNSVISLIKAKSPGLWDGEYIDAGVVLASKENSNYNTNAIDANIFTDSDGKTYFIWGSFWKGIHMAELDADTGLVKGVDYTSDATILSSCQSFGTRMYSTPAGVAGPEGAYTVYNEDTGYRYMFASYGWLGTNYNIRVARTDKTFTEILSGNAPHKQLLDQQGRPVGATYADQVKEGGSLDELWGYKMSGSFQLGDGIEYLGSGHNSVFKDDDGQWYLVQHCRKVADAVAYLQVKKILWTKDGWPVISPLVYAGEEEQEIPEQMLYGAWDLSSVGHTILKDGVTDVSKCTSSDFDLPVHSSRIILQPDGTIGDYLGTWKFDGDHTVTLSFEADGEEDNYEFYQAGDTMTLFVMTGYDKDKRESAVVMTGTDQNGIASFAKKNNQTAQSTKNPVRITTTSTVIEKSTGGNPILGFDADGNTAYGGDPSVLVDGDTVYAYVGHDVSATDDYNIPEYLCYSSTDLVSWGYRGSVFSVNTTTVPWASGSDSAWASQVLKRNGKYYLYYCTWGNSTYSGYQCIGVAESDSPTGPFTNKSTTPLINGKTMTTENSSTWNDIDPTGWIETDENGDEHIYLNWGNGENYTCELNDDMISVKDKDGDGSITSADIVRTTFTGLDGTYTEAPYLYRRADEDGNYTGKYYLFFAKDWREQWAYATTDDIMSGEWDYGSLVMPATATSNTSHGAVFDFGGKTYFLYHNGSLPWGSGFRRVANIQEMTFDENGKVDSMTEMSTGISGTPCILVSAAKGVGVIYHQAFTNSLSDSDYPIKKQLYAGEPTTEEISSDEDSWWEIEQGKADAENESYVSIQSVNKPGLYICADGNNAALTQQDTVSKSLARKMTFKTVEGIDGTEGTVSFESVSKPGYFLTASDGQLVLSNGSDADACSFEIHTWQE